jgi:glycine cleavage system H protein
MTTKYTKDHEWVSVAGNIATCGITAYAAEQLGDVVFVELPNIGRIVSQGDEVAVVESVKAASDVYAPVSGEVVDVNEALAEAPEGVNEAAETTGWFTKLKLTDPVELDALMDRAAYDTYLAGL